MGFRLASGLLVLMSRHDGNTESSRQKSSPRSEIPLPSCPITEFPQDVVIAALDFLNAPDLASASAASRLLLLLAGVEQRRGTVVTAVGTPSEVIATLTSQLQATPTMGFVFGNVGESASILARRLPACCQVIGAASDELQALVPKDKTTTLQHANARRSRQVAVLLGSFPNAVVQSFHVSTTLCAQLSQSSGKASGLALLKANGLPTGDWKTIVVTVSSNAMRSRADPERIINVFQQSNPEAAIIGGVAGDQVLVHSRGKTRVEESGIVGLALKGDVPLTALVSRGCVPLTPRYRARGARPVSSEDSDDDENMLLIPELLNSEGTAVPPFDTVVQAMQARMSAPAFSGLRHGKGGYFLEGLSRERFPSSGGILLNRGTLSEAQATDVDVRFFALDAAACRTDLRQMLSHVRDQSEEREEQTIGAVMFTCGGRSEGFFHEEFVDAKEFQAVFPSVPCVGFWAGGEIGPQALAEASPEEATRTGRAALQGFTAVFGIFRAPAPRRFGVQVDEQRLPTAVGEVLSRLAMEAKERGNSAFKDKDFRDAVLHYSRAVALSSVPSACVPDTDRASFFSNRAMAFLKVGDDAEALVDADEAVSLYPLHAKAHHRRGQALLNLKRPQDALVGLRRALDRLPEEGALKELCARAAAAAKEPDVAAEPEGEPPREPQTAGDWLSSLGGGDSTSQ